MAADERVVAAGQTHKPLDMIDDKCFFLFFPPWLIVYLSSVPWIKGILAPNWFEPINYPCLFYFRTTIALSL